MHAITIRLLTLVLALAVAPWVSAADPDPLLAQMGAETYLELCASCHGPEARGDGPVAPSLATPPADLRRIAERRGGSFPVGEIARKIDGRFDLPAHGTRDMPVWGRRFAADVPDARDAEAIARGRVAVLVEYLQTIQESEATADPAATRAAMQRIFAAMRVLLPLSLDGTRFEDPENARAIGDALAVLDANASGLPRHGASADVAFAHLARSLAIDARDVQLRHQQGHVREARYLVQTLTETCVACHSRLPSGSAPTSAAVTAELEAGDLPLEQRAKLAYATRQFDVTADLYEAMLVSEPPNTLDLSGQVDDYLELTLRVLRNPERAREALLAFAARDDLSPALREDVNAWTAGLAELRGAESNGDAPARAQALVAREKSGGLTFSRSELPAYLEASGMLHRALAGGLVGEERAEAYYLLGWIETRIGKSYWLSQAEAYLETAIRVAPRSEVAGLAYALLEEFLVVGYTGSGGTHVPPELQAKLDTLRWIAQPPASG